MTRAIVAMLFAAACGGGSKAAPVEQPTGQPAGEEASSGMPITGSCSRPGMMQLYRTVAPPHSPFSDDFRDAESTAQGETEKGLAAYEAEDDALAASHFLSCVQAYARVPAADGKRDHATKNAELCLTNAATAYANAGTFDSVGRAKLEAAAKADAALEPKIRGYLENPPSGCASTKQR